MIVVMDRYCIQVTVVIVVMDRYYIQVTVVTVVMDRYSGYGHGPVFR